MVGLSEAVKPQLADIDFNRSPFIVIWEMTRSCKLKCTHCRAEAIDGREPGELTTAEARALLKEIRLFGKPLVVLTGGDPLRRPDAFELVEYGVSMGLRMTMTPSGTDETTRVKVRRLKAAGLSRLAVSLDGSSAAIHDAFRGVPGSFEWTLDIIRRARECGLPVQINTTMTRHNFKDLDALVELLSGLGIAMWSVFFLVPVGRGRIEEEMRGAEYEKVFHKMAELAVTAPFDIKSTEAPHYRRVLLERKKNGGALRMPGAIDGVGRAAKGVNDGNGFAFISHTGEIYPSGFLPVSAGNVKKDSLVDVYREAPIFKELRDHSRLKGKCGACGYKTVCGGSRSRAYAVTGDYLAQDPFCVHIPKGYIVDPDEWRYW